MKTFCKILVACALFAGAGHAKAAIHGGWGHHWGGHGWGGHGWYGHGYGYGHGWGWGGWGWGVGVGWPYYGYGYGYYPYYSYPYAYYPGYYPGYYNYGYAQPAYRTTYDSKGVSRVSSVSQVQAALERQGYSVGGVDGVLGEQSRAAIRSYQAAHRLPVTGTIDAPLLHSLRVG